MNRKILIIITGSVAAYKAVDLVRNLQKKSYDVKVILTKAAQQFVTKLLVNSLVGEKNVYTELFDEDDTMTHIRLSRGVDLVLVAPASADFIAKMANGYCDDLASTAVSASNKDIMVAPAMNEKMWKNQANIENIKKLQKSDKILLINPIEDILACGEEGIGKMEDISVILQKIDEYFDNSISLKGKIIILTGGGTREAIDSVRYIGNSSSGKQALEIAKMAKKAGGDIRFVAANISLDIELEKNKVYRVTSAQEMFEKVNELLDEFERNLQDVIFISCAAVADYRAKEISDIKIKKGDSDEFEIKLVKNVDILSEIANGNKRPGMVVGFAAEDGDVLLTNAREKLRKKNCDMIVANDINGGKIFGSEISDAFLVTKDEVLELKNSSKKEIANQIIKFIANIAQN